MISVLFSQPKAVGIVWLFFHSINILIAPFDRISTSSREKEYILVEYMFAISGEYHQKVSKAVPRYKETFLYICVDILSSDIFRSYNSTILLLLAKIIS